MLAPGFAECFLGQQERGSETIGLPFHSVVPFPFYFDGNLADFGVQEVVAQLMGDGEDIPGGRGVGGKPNRELAGAAHLNFAGGGRIPPIVHFHGSAEFVFDKGLDIGAGFETQFFGNHLRDSSNLRFAPVGGNRGMKNRHGGFAHWRFGWRVVRLERPGVPRKFIL